MARVPWLGVGCVLVLLPSGAAAGVGGHVELFGGLAMPHAGDTSGDLNYTDQVETSPKVGLRGGPVWAHGHLFAGIDGSVDQTWYRETDDAAALSRFRMLAGARVGYASDSGGIIVGRAAAGIDRVSVDFHDILADLCGNRSSDTGLGWELAGGTGYRHGRLTYSVQLAVTGGRHGDHRPACTSPGVPPFEVDVLDYNAVDIDVTAGVDVSF